MSRFFLGTNFTYKINIIDISYIDQRGQGVGRRPHHGNYAPLSILKEVMHELEVEIERS